MAGLRWGRFLGRFNKYGAKAVTVDGLYFRSGKEARRWKQLVLEEKLGLIRDLRRQVPYPLHVPDPNGGDPKVVGAYIADAVYVRMPKGPTSPGAQVVEDSKGFRTPLYRWKAKHFTLEYGLDILET